MNDRCYSQLNNLGVDVIRKWMAILIIWALAFAGGYVAYAATFMGWSDNWLPTGSVLVLVAAALFLDFKFGPYAHQYQVANKRNQTKAAHS